MVGTEVPGKLCKITAPHQLAMGVKASLILSSNPGPCAAALQEDSKTKRREKIDLENERSFISFLLFYAIS
jgi:hypothetical protein